MPAGTSRGSARPSHLVEKGETGRRSGARRQRCPGPGRDAEELLQRWHGKQRKQEQQSRRGENRAEDRASRSRKRSRRPVRRQIVPPGAAAPAAAVGAGELKRPRHAATARPETGGDGSRTTGAKVGHRRGDDGAVRRQPKPRSARAGQEARAVPRFDRAREREHQLSIIAAPTSGSTSAPISGISSGSPTRRAFRARAIPSRTIRPLRATNNVNLDLRSSIAITADIGLEVEGEVRSGGERIERQEDREHADSTWPTLTLDWKGMEKYRFLNRYIAPEQSRARIRAEEERERRAGMENAYSLSPNWNLDWKNTLSSNLSCQLHQEDAREEQPGALGQELERRRRP